MLVGVGTEGTPSPDSTTMGIALMYGGLEKRTGARVKPVTLSDKPWQATVDEMVTRLVAGVTPRTKAIAGPGFTPLV